MCCKERYHRVVFISVKLADWIKYSELVCASGGGAHLHIQDLHILKVHNIKKKQKKKQKKTWKTVYMCNFGVLRD